MELSTAEQKVTLVAMQ